MSADPSMAQRSEDASTVERAVKHFFTTIDNSKNSLGSLKHAAKLYALATDPSKGLINPVFGLDDSYSIKRSTLNIIGANPTARAEKVDRKLAAFLNDAIADHTAAPGKLASMSVSMRTLVGLRFFALSSWDVCLAAEQVQYSLETVLDDEAYEDCADDLTDAAVAQGEFYVTAAFFRTEAHFLQVPIIAGESMERLLVRLERLLYTQLQQLFEDGNLHSIWAIYSNRIGEFLALDNDVVDVEPGDVLHANVSFRANGSQYRPEEGLLQQRIPALMAALAEDDAAQAAAVAAAPADAAAAAAAPDAAVPTVEPASDSAVSSDYDDDDADWDSDDSDEM